MKLFYDDVSHVKIKDLNDQNNVEIFTTSRYVEGKLLLQNRKLENLRQEYQN